MGHNDLGFHLQVKKKINQRKLYLLIADKSKLNEAA